MTVPPALEWLAFGVLSATAIAGAIGMTTTMGMFRSAIFLMASFLGVAGLFVLLAADLLAWLTVMMYVGGMLVMALFMVLMSHDPGGDMMAGMMKLVGFERLFSAGLAAPGDGAQHGAGHGGSGHEVHGGGGHGGGGREDHGAGGAGGDAAHGTGGHGGGEHGGPHGGDGGMADMSMFTPLKRWAMALALAVGALLCALILLRPAFPVVSEPPDPDSARQVGLLLMGKYMMAFEAAGLLILLGVFGGVWAARAGTRADVPDRARLQAAVDAPPAEITDEPLGLAAGGSPGHDETRAADGGARDGGRP